MRKARLLQSVAILAGSLALTLAPADSRGQSAIDSGSQGYQTYGYGMPGSGAFDQQFRSSEQRLYGAADQYGVDRSIDPYGNQPWPQQAFDQPQGFPYPGQRIYGQGQGAFGGPAYGPYGPQGSRGFEPGQQTFGQGQFLGQQGWPPRAGQQDWQRYGQQAMGGNVENGMARPFGQQPDFSQQGPRAAGQSDAERYRQEAMRQAYGQNVYGGYDDRYSAYQGAGGQFGQQPQYGMQGQFQQPGQGQPQYGMQGQFQQPWQGQPQYGMQGSFQRPWQGQPQYGMQGQFQQPWPGQQYGMQGQFQQPWQGQQYGTQGQFQRDGRFVQDPGQELDRFGHPGGYPQFGRFDPGQMAYGQNQGDRLPQGHMQGHMMGQGGMGFDQQAHGAARSGGAMQQQVGSGAERIHVVSAGELVGRAVTDQTGQEIGTSRYIVIGAQSGRVHFVMVGSGANDQLDLGTDLLPVPWSVVDAGQDQRIALSVPSDRLRELPRVAPSELASVTGPQLVGRISQLITTSPDENGSAGQGTTAGQTGQQSGTQQPATSDTTQSGQSSTSGATGQQDQAATTGTGQPGTAGQTGTDQSQQAQAGQQPTQGGSRDQIASADPGAGLGDGQEDVVVLGGRYGALVAPPSLLTEGELAGTTVFSADGMPIGDIDEILIDERRGQVAYVLVSTGGFLGADQRWLPVPFTAMTWMPTRMGFALQIQSSQLATLPALAQGTPPRFIRGRDLATLYYAYGAQPYWLRPGGAGSAGFGEDRG